MKKSSNSFSKSIVFIIILFILIQQVIPMVYIVDGSSMLPTYKEGQITLIDYYHFNSQYTFQDVVVIQLKSTHTKMIKRIIGVAGDHVQIIDNKLYINEIEIEEDYLYEPMQSKDMDFIIPENKFFVLGDNRNKSIDSRKLGLIDQEDILGKVIYVKEK